MDLDDLLRHRAWIRDLALTLTRREAEADDVSQDTVLAALHGSPRDPVHPRAWLAAVVRNFARRRHRSAVRRATHEAAASCRPSSREADPAALAARAEIHSIVVAAVVALEEPYRAAVLLRHFEGLPVAEVARRTGVPLETARARLRRGREMLRARLDRRVGGGNPLSALLLPLLDAESGSASGAGSPALVAAGASIMTTRV
ncbi:MAG: RNA polymerase sigma factor, partial [Planctomycetes bacterium]|nr:RNA polymerase sigma factor [Planctomycetota bacterium]